MPSNPDLHYELAAAEWDIEPATRDLAAMRGAAEGCEAVLHVAGIVAESPPEVTFQGVNVEGTRWLVEEAERRGVDPMLLAGLVMTMFNRLVTIHVVHIARHLGELAPQTLKHHLKLQRSVDRQDELSLLESQVNELQDNLHAHLERQRSDELAIAASRDQLVELVEAREICACLPDRVAGCGTAVKCCSARSQRSWAVGGTCQRKDLIVGSGRASTQEPAPTPRSHASMWPVHRYAVLIDQQHTELITASQREADHGIADAMDRLRQDRQILNMMLGDPGARSLDWQAEQLSRVGEALEFGVVGVNTVQPEDAYGSMTTFDELMKMFAYLRPLYPKVRVTAHAGELARFGQKVPFADNTIVRTHRPEGGVAVEPGSIGVA